MGKCDPKGSTLKRNDEHRFLFSVKVAISNFVYDILLPATIITKKYRTN